MRALTGYPPSSVLGACLERADEDDEAIEDLVEQQSCGQGSSLASATGRSRPGDASWVWTIHGTSGSSRRSVAGETFKTITVLQVTYLG
ncbi:hypothetical protein [Streptomyces collinus]|uniref:Uncharacterized protein n=1 Tax=Streptomyces collinus (strain DSM 40733 / Tue 365) TaxID=1214242 RepID=S5VF16_STRC3|nr:hypothetical protein [Streptomyces collinus]AGS66890.1 hypothetical protein B446_00240 [Streptomyces collinus Tu 365]AGS73804.1 hypothetical protein B446_35050 [Streptomyces collinus Tu 365]